MALYKSVYYYYYYKPASSNFVPYFRIFLPHIFNKIFNKTEWWGAGMVICPERGADLHTAQLMPLPLTVSCVK